MSAVDTRAARERRPLDPAAPPDHHPATPPGSSSDLLSGWGGTAPTRAEVLRPRDVEEACAVLAAAARRPAGVIARGAGRSYGDAAQNAHGLVLETGGLRFIGDLDEEQSTVRVGAGTTLAELLRELHPRRLTLPVTPGTQHVTVGGAIAADVHGKNAFSDGSFGRHVESLTLITPSGEMLGLSAQSDEELFLATLGGMGLTGIVADATLRVEPLTSRRLWMDIDRCEDLEGALALMSDLGGAHRFAIAWIDLLNRRGGAGSRPNRGRSVVLRSAYAEPTPADAAAPPVALLRRSPLLNAPRWTPGGLLRPALVRAFNELRWHRAPRQARQRPCGWESHFFPLDALAHWNRLYRPDGLVQYQFAVPMGREAALLEVVRLLQRKRLPMYLVVLKRLGPGSGGPLSFPLDGFTLAIDIPAAAPGLPGALDQADELVVQAGGRIYLAKDSRARAQTLREMYPGLERFAELRARVDPCGVLQSDLARRLALCGGRRRSER